jgi:hypothetical protein
MIEPRNRTALALAAFVTAVALSILAVPAMGAAAVHFTPEPYKALQGQIAAGQVKAAAFNKKAHSIHVTLKDGRHVIASYPSHDEPTLAAQLSSKGATVKVKKAKKKAVHHKLRYIAGGVLIVVIVVVALVLGLNRRRPRDGEPAAPPGAVPPAAGGGGTPPAPAQPGPAEAEPVSRTEPPAG